MLTAKSQLHQQKVEKKDHSQEEDQNAEVILDLVSVEEHLALTDDAHLEDLVVQEVAKKEQLDDTLDVHQEMVLDLVDSGLVLQEEILENLEWGHLRQDLKDHLHVVDKRHIS